MKLYPLTAILIFSILSSTNIWPDIIYLKDGSTLEGQILDTRDDFLSLYDFERNRRIPTQSIERVEMGFSGIQVCVIGSGIKDCNRILHALGGYQTIFLTGKGNLETEVTKTRSLEAISWQRTSSRDKFSFYLRTGIRIRVFTKKREFRGEYQGRTDKGLLAFHNLLTSDDSSNGSINHTDDKILISETEVLGWEWKNEPGIWEGMGLQSFLIPIPGALQWTKGERLKGGILLGGSILAIAGSAMEFNRSRNQAIGSFSFLPIGERWIVVQNPRGGNSYKNHLRNSQALGGIAGIFLIYHLWDLYQTNSWGLSYQSSGASPGFFEDPQIISPDPPGRFLSLPVEFGIREPQWQFQIFSIEF